MNITNNLQLGAVTTLTNSGQYQADPQQLFQQLCGQKRNNLLLESAEIDKKQQLKSILLTDVALKIVCQSRRVSFHALTLNGEAALAFAKQQLTDVAELSDSTARHLVATFALSVTEVDEQARLLAINPLQSLRIFTQLNNLQQHPFAVFLAGVFAFDLITLTEQLPEVADGDNSCPDFVYYLAETLVVIDHEQRSSAIIGNVFSGAQQQKCYFEISRRLAQIKQTLAQNMPQPVSPTVNPPMVAADIAVNIDDAQFCQIVETLKQHIRAGDIFQVVPSRCFSLPCTDSLAAYQALKLSNPSPYMFYLQDSEFCIFGASPESAIKYQHHNRRVEIYPIAGTRPRGVDAQGELLLDLDSRIELELRQDKKELAEHIMLVDLARNDVARVSQAGTRYVADLLKVDRYSHVMHLVSRVCGTLQPQLDALHAYQACMNMGTLSGAPKVKATELIRHVERKRRGSYGGAVGYLTGEGEMDTCIVIRSAFVKHNIAYVQAGAGVVYDSIPSAEATETRQKAQAVLNAIQVANQQPASTNKPQLKEPKP
jgi:anthranilate synthase component I